MISLKASRYSPRYIDAMEMCLRFFADYAEAQGWPETSRLTASHIEEYLVHLQERPRWLVERSHVERNPLDLIKHPRFEERVIPTVNEEELLKLLELVNPRLEDLTASAPHCTT